MTAAPTPAIRAALDEAAAAVSVARCGVAARSDDIAAAAVAAFLRAMPDLSIGFDACVYAGPGVEQFIAAVERAARGGER